MDSITLQNYRCFGSEEQTARLAPLTLLVGPNSTGKTSFLALIRALWDVAFREVVPNFREEPFDLGSFGEIVHASGTRSARVDSFAASFERGSLRDGSSSVTYAVDFTDQMGSPLPGKRRLTRGKTRWEVARTGDMKHVISFATSNGSWQRTVDIDRGTGSAILLVPLTFFYWERILGRSIFGEESRSAWTGSNRTFDDGDIQLASALSAEFMSWTDVFRPFAGSPVRSRPRRTYDSALQTSDPGGDDTPSFLASLFRQRPETWLALRNRLEDYGRSSGLFDEISVRSFGTSGGDPFQIQFRTHSGPKSKRRKGPWRNLIDIGYGVSQVLPILAQLLREDAPQLFLFQQPEVHLHPQAQAALGTLFCEVAAGGRQLVVETHSDYIIDRVRMDVRDQTTGLKPEDVSILYFEPRDLDVKIHSIRLDEMGNVLDAPPGYRKFFMEEMRRSIGL